MTGHGQDSPQPIDVLTAAARLGISPDAVRKRIARGQLVGTKRGGRWYALLSVGPDTDTPAGQIGPDTDRTADELRTRPGPDRRDELVEQLRSEIGFLREENRRKDAIIAALVDRPRLLPAPAADRTRPDSGPDTDSRQTADSWPQDANLSGQPPRPSLWTTLRAWWRRR